MQKGKYIRARQVDEGRQAGRWKLADEKANIKAKTDMVDEGRQIGSTGH